MTHRLVCILKHATQYDPFLWARMADRGKVEPLVWYLQGTAPRDTEIQRSVSWPTPDNARHRSEVIDQREIVARLQNLQPAPSAILTYGWTGRAAWLAVWAGKRRRIPIILSTDKIDPIPSGLQALRPSALWHRIIKNHVFDGFLTTGSLGIASLESAGVRRERIARWFYPIDVRWWQTNMKSQQAISQTIRAEAGQGVFLVLAVKKWSTRENPLLLLKAFALLRKLVPAAFLVLIGDGPLRPQVEATIQSLSLQNAVRLPGYVRYEKLPGYYGAADAFVHLADPAAWEISVAEALACGVPVVAGVNVGAAHELVVPGVSGQLVPIGDPQAIAQALHSLAEARISREVVRASAQRVDVDAASAELEDSHRTTPFRSAANPGNRHSDPVFDERPPIHCDCVQSHCHSMTELRLCRCCDAWRGQYYPLEPRLGFRICTKITTRCRKFKRLLFRRNPFPVRIRIGFLLPIH